MTYKIGFSLSGDICSGTTPETESTELKSSHSSRPNFEKKQIVRNESLKNV